MPLVAIPASVVLTLLTISVTLAQSTDSVPRCLKQCLEHATQPCSSASLPLLVNCVNEQCTSESDAHTTFSAASMSLVYTPKKQYSCQQSNIPGSSEDAAPIQLIGDGTCETSSYNFQSLFVSASEDTASDEVDVTLQRMATHCAMMLYPNEECKGKETRLDLSNMQGDKCVFRGGRSAKLLCTALRQPDTQTSYANLISNLCTNATPTSPASSNSTSPYASSGSGTGAGAANSTTSITPPQPSATPVPYTGLGNGHGIESSVIALVALSAAAALML